MSIVNTELNQSIEFRKRFVAMCGTANPRVISEYLDISYQAAKNYLDGRMPEPKMLLRFADKTPVSLHWLLTGEGDKYVERAIHTEAEMLASVLSDLADAATLRKIFEVISEAQIDLALAKRQQIEQDKSVRTVKIKSNKVRKQKQEDTVDVETLKKSL